MTLVPVPLDKMVPLPELFRHRSTLHGQAHVSRVMIHAMRLIEATGRHAYGPQLWASVSLHDLARTHDGVCDRHGARMPRNACGMNPACSSAWPKRGWSRPTIPQ